MLADEVLVDAVRRNDVICDGIQDREIGLRREHHLNIGEIEGSMLECRKHRDTNMRRAEPAVGDPAPKNWVHLRHVRAPQHESVCGFEVVVAAHWFVHAERPHESHDGRRHAVTRIRVDVV